MFKNIHASDMEKAVTRVLDILANVADITEPRNYIFDKVESIETHTFKPRKKRKSASNNREFKINWVVVSFYTLLTSLFSLVMVLALVSKNHYIITSLWSPLGILVSFLIGVIGIAEILIAVGSALKFIRFIRAREGGKKSAQQMLKQAKEDAIAYLPVVNEICTIAKGQQLALNAAESIIKSLVIEKSQVIEKNVSNLLPILATGLIVLCIIFFGVPIQLPENTSFYNKAITIVGWETLVLPIVLPIAKFIAESESQSLILKFKRCLFILEQAQIRVNNTNQQVIPIASTKPRPQFGSARGLIQMSDDFDAPLADFDEYMP